MLPAPPWVRGRNPHRGLGHRRNQTGASGHRRNSAPNTRGVFCFRSGSTYGLSLWIPAGYHDRSTRGDGLRGIGMHIRFARVAVVASLVIVSGASMSHATRTTSSSLGNSASGARRPFTVCTTGTDVIDQNETWSATKASAYIVGCTVEVA